MNRGHDPRKVRGSQALADPSGPASPRHSTGAKTASSASGVIGSGASRLAGTAAVTSLRASGSAKLSGAGQKVASVAGRTVASSAGRGAAVSGLGRKVVSVAGRGAVSGAGQKVVSVAGRTVASSAGRKVVSVAGRGAVSGAGRTVASSAGRKVVTGSLGVQPGNGRRRLAVAASAGTLSVAAGVGLAVQHRKVARARDLASSVDRRQAGLALPSDVVHHRVDTDDGGIVHVIERGTGTPIVLVHGVTLAAGLWAQQLAVLGEGHRVIAVDLRGHGQSVPGRDGFGGGVVRLAADVRQVIEALGVEGAMLVGHSLGGMTAMQLVVDADPAWLARRLVALALVDTSAGPLADLWGNRLVHRPVTAALSRMLLLAERAGLAGRSTDIGWWAARAAFGPDPDPTQVAFTDALGSATPLATLGGLLGPLASFDVAERIGDIRLPTLVVVGSHDHLTPVSHARRLAQAIPDAELVELPRAGHMPMLERPRELCRLLQELLDRATVGA